MDFGATAKMIWPARTIRYPSPEATVQLFCRAPAARRVRNPTCPRWFPEIVFRQYGRRCPACAKPNAASADYSGNHTATDHATSAAATSAQGKRLDEGRRRAWYSASAECSEQFGAFG